jgi:hypothetical protein
MRWRISGMASALISSGMTKSRPCVAVIDYPSRDEEREIVLRHGHGNCIRTDTRGANRTGTRRPDHEQGDILGNLRNHRQNNERPEPPYVDGKGLGEHVGKCFGADLTCPTIA